MATSLTFIFFLLIMIIVTYIFLKTSRNKKSKPETVKNLPPGSFGWPFLGETLAMLHAVRAGTPERFIRDRVERYGRPPVFKTSLMGERTAVFCGPEGNKFLFANENKLVASWWPSSIRKLFGKCLNTSQGDEAKWLRKLMLAYLGPDSFSSSYTATIDTVTRLHIQNRWQGKEEVNVFKTVKLYAFELACRLFLSLEDPEHIAKLGSLFNIFLKGLVAVPLNIPGTRFYRARKAADAIKMELIAIIKQRRVALDGRKATTSQDILSHFLVSYDENGRFLSEIEIANNILLLLFAGHDTSTIAITLLMKSLAEHPQVYQKVLREQLDISEAKGPGELLKWEDIQKMRYSWNVICEVLRLNPPVGGTYREALVDFEYAGYTIPKGWKLYMSATFTHKEEDNFANVTKFDPSRFEGAGPTPFTYVPFGGGPRMCLGKEFSRLEVLVFLHNLVTKFKWDLLIPDEKIRV